jgi:hypothetical protein
VNFKERAPTSVFEKTSNKFKGTLLGLLLIGFIPKADSRKLNLELDNDGGGGLLLNLNLLFFDFSYIL